jgi:hypothetical protein
MNTTFQKNIASVGSPIIKSDREYHEYLSEKETGEKLITQNESV